MKFSYTLLKKLAPMVAIKNKNELMEKLSLHSFEAEDAGGDAIDVKLPPNRISDAGGHIGLAREIAAVYGGKSIKYQVSSIKAAKKTKTKFKVEIQNKNLCSRYAGRYFENVKVGQSPKWMQKILISCGMRPINGVVDIMNYAMLETGQPLHAFDYDKIEGNIIVRKAKKGEKITTLDNQEIELNENILIIADDKNPLAIAGIKGGKKAEVDKNTKRIIIEAANFDATNIYRSSRNLGIITDASLRFSRVLSSELVSMGLARAEELLKKICKAKSGQAVDVNFNKAAKKIVKFDIKKFTEFIGLELDFIIISKYLSRLGFRIIQDSRFKIQDSFLVEVPPFRQDIESGEDLFEEAIRLYGYNNLKAVPPKIHLAASGFEDSIILKNKIRNVLVGLGFDEVQNTSFTAGRGAGSNFFVEVENPISKDKKYLRSSLLDLLINNIESNSRFFDKIKIFEIGKVFNKYQVPNIKYRGEISENLRLGMVVASKNKDEFFELKGIANEFFKKIGLVDYFLASEGNGLKIESGKRILGYLTGVKIGELREWHSAALEINLDELIKLIEEEHEFRPLPKYPSIMRDVSIWIDKTAAVGDIMRAIQEADLNLIEDVDLIDEYEKAEENRKSLAFRIVFQAQDRTLTDAEVNKIMEKIIKEIREKFNAEIR